MPPNPPLPSTYSATTIASRKSIGLDEYSPPSHLKEWTVLGCIGQGSFGVIHRVQRRGDGYIAAMKQLDYSKMPAKDRKQILEEVRILDSLKSRHVVQLVDKILDRTDQKMYIIMEYCGGGDLSRTLATYKNQRKTIPEPLIWNYFIQLVLGLNHCHHPEERTAGPGEGAGGPSSSSSGSSSAAGGLGSMGQETGLRRKLEALGIEEGGTGSASSSSGFGTGLGLGIGPGAGAGAGVRKKSMREVTGQVLHRDLKPENIFLDEFDNIKLGDFGLSKNLGAGGFTQTYVGTPLYMPPEILTESKYDLKGDIWSLGCLIYELCTLSSPFASARTQQELLAKVKLQKYEPIGPGYSAGLRELVTRMLQLNPKSRPTTKELLGSTEMKYWKKEYERRKQKAEHDKVAVELEKKVDQILSFKEAVVAREQAFLARQQAVEVKERQLAEKEEAINAQIEEQERQYNLYQTQLQTDYEALCAEKVRFEEQQKRIKEREAEVEMTERRLGTAQRSLEWEKKQLILRQERFEAEVARWEAMRSTSPEISKREETALKVTEPSSRSEAPVVEAVVTRQPLQERSAPNIVGKTSFMPKKRSPLTGGIMDFMDLDSPAKSHLNSVSPSLKSGIPRPSASPSSFARNGTPLRIGGRLATKSFNDLRARAKRDSESGSEPMPNSPAENSIIMMDLGTPIHQSKSKPDLFYSDLNLDIDKLQSTNSAKLNQSLAEAARPGEADVDLLFARAEGKRPLDLAELNARAKSGRPMMPHANTTTVVPAARSILAKMTKIPLPSAEFVYKENATPAKWSPEDDDVPSPFLKNNRRALPAGMMNGSPVSKGGMMSRASAGPELLMRPRKAPSLMKLATMGAESQKIRRQSAEQAQADRYQTGSVSAVDRLL